MKIQKEKIIQEFDRDLYWTRLFISSDNGSRETKILAAASEEYLRDVNKLPGGSKLAQSHLEQWLDSVEQKWTRLGEMVFNQDVHYDVYSVTKEGEANGIDFLINEVK